MLQFSNWIGRGKVAVLRYRTWFVDVALTDSGGQGGAGATVSRSAQWGFA